MGWRDGSRRRRDWLAEMMRQASGYCRRGGRGRARSRGGRSRRHSGRRGRAGCWGSGARRDCKVVRGARWGRERENHRPHVLRCGLEMEENARWVRLSRVEAGVFYTWPKPGQDGPRPLVYVRRSQQSQRVSGIPERYCAIETRDESDHRVESADPGAGCTGW